MRVYVTAALEFGAIGSFRLWVPPHRGCRPQLYQLFLYHARYTAAELRYHDPGAHSRDDYIQYPDEERVGAFTCILVGFRTLEFVWRRC